MMIKPSLAEILSVNYRQHPRYRGCVGHWLMNEGGGLTAYDISGNYNNGTLTDGPTWSVGQFGQALNLDGVNDHVAISNISSSLFSNQEATFVLWVKLINHIDANGSWSFSAANFNMHYPWTDGNIYDGTFRSSRVDGIGAGIVTDRTRWHQVAITRKAGADGWKFYQNAIQVFSTDGGTWDMATSVTIGKSFENFFIEGLIDDARIYNRALTAGEVASLYNDSFLEFRQARRIYFDLAAGGEFDPATIVPSLAQLGSGGWVGRIDV